MSAGSPLSGVIPGFDVQALQRAATEHFGSDCLEFSKIGEGVYHKVFLLRLDDLTSKVTQVVARVAKPCFPRDKMESEIATFRYLARHTSLPVPKVYTWNSDATNPVGAEYMFVEKVEGVDTSTVWDHLGLSAKLVFLEDLATYLHEVFLLRFDKAGSLYLVGPGKQDHSDDSAFTIGPIVSAPFYHREERSPISSHLNRGPYNTVFEFLGSWPATELAYLEEHPQEAIRWYANHAAEYFPNMKPEELTEEAITAKYNCCIETLRIHLQSSSTYGALPPSTVDPDPVFSASVFTLYLDDLNLSNLMVDPMNGHITGFIDLEGAFTAPLWLVPPLPSWLCCHTLSGEGAYDDWSEGVDIRPKSKAAYEEEILREAFISRMNQLDLAGPLPKWSCLTSAPNSPSGYGSPDDGGQYRSGQWVRALKNGYLYRTAWRKYAIGWPTWDNPYYIHEAESLLEWARSHPGVPRPEAPFRWWTDSNSLSSSEGSDDDTSDSEGSYTKYDDGGAKCDAGSDYGEVGRIVTVVETQLKLDEVDSLF